MLHRLNWKWGSTEFVSKHGHNIWDIAIQYIRIFIIIRYSLSLQILVLSDVQLEKAFKFSCSEVGIRSDKLPQLNR